MLRFRRPVRKSCAASRCNGNRQCLSDVVALCAAARNLSLMTCDTGCLGAFCVVRDFLRPSRCVAKGCRVERRNQHEPRNATCIEVLECIATRVDMPGRAGTCWDDAGCAGALVESVARRPPMVIITAVTHDHPTRGALLRSTSCVTEPITVMGHRLSTDATPLRWRVPYDRP